jgi:hypothetical protein
LRALIQGENPKNHKRDYQPEFQVFTDGKNNEAGTPGIE